MAMAAMTTMLGSDALILTADPMPPNTVMPTMKRQDKASLTALGFAGQSCFAYLTSISPECHY
jgi:hypothetical protein